MRVRIEVANPDERLKPDMYADVMFHADGDRAAVTTVPASAIIDNGAQQIVLVAKGEGRFEPRPVKLGRRGDGYVEIVEGLKPGEDIVTTATFLIDAESNLQSGAQDLQRAGGSRNDCRPHPLVGAQPAAGRVRRRLPDAGRPLRGVAGAARRDSRSLRRAGHRLHRISRPGAAGGRGSGHLSAHHGDAERAEIEGGARLLVLRRLVRLRDLRGRHRPLLGALARAGISQFGRPPAAGRRGAEPRAGRHRRRLGLSIRRARRAEEPGRAAHACRTGTSATASPRPRASPRSPASAASSSSTAS